MKSITAAPLPEWLAEIKPDSPFPLLALLDGSLYYPAAGTDGKPVQYLIGFVHSFVYVDYAMPQQEVELELARQGFRGYKPMLSWDLKESDLVPNGWTPMHPTRGDGNPRKYATSMAKPYALWIVFERDAELNESHGPQRFSLLYICGDGVATYQAIYGGNSVSPKVLAIIQPGTGFGLNYTDFRDSDKILARSVRRFSTTKPPFMLYGGNRIGREGGYPTCCWPEYAVEVERWLTARTVVGLWKMS